MQNNSIPSFVKNSWVSKNSSENMPIKHAYTGENIFSVNTKDIAFKEMVEYARNVGAKNLAQFTFHQRALKLKYLGKYLLEQKEKMYALAEYMGASKKDAWIDIEGGIATLFTYSSKGRRELPDQTFLVEGSVEVLSKEGQFVGQHISVPKGGVAVHINAFNFPVWGMLEKLAPNWLAGMPAIIKPASSTCFLTQKCVELIVESKMMPEGSIQLISGPCGDLLDYLNYQDVVTFTGSESTGRKIKSHPTLLKNNVTVNLETDSLNCAILSEREAPDSKIIELFAKEVSRELFVKSGQKCTAIRRAFVPKKYLDHVSKLIVDNIRNKEFGPLVNEEQCDEVCRLVKELEKSKYASIYYQGVIKDQNSKYASHFPPTLFKVDDPLEDKKSHELEIFGPVCSLMPYENKDQLEKMIIMGGGSLVGSIFSSDSKWSCDVAMKMAPHHGRILIIDEDSAKESTGHGSPLPHLKHGGPGRAGGGEDMAGTLGLHLYLQRVAIQASPSCLSELTGQWVRGAKIVSDPIHPFRKYFEELQIGETLWTHRRTVTEGDITHFAGLSGDFFYAHTDEIAAKDSIFEKRVAHGYFLISAAAGLFVHPAYGPVLANYGLEKLRFVNPVGIGDTIQVRITVKEKIKKEKREGERLQGVVRWDVEIINQHKEQVALYEILTLVERKVDEF